jgi:tetratricopeptide (TPR) repeat protein
MKHVSPALNGSAWLFVVLICACRAQPPAPHVQPVSLPDISRAAPAVQQQIRDQYATLQQNISSADAYGSLGRLLIATEFYDAAATCFLDAQALAPQDMRWPYYLAHVERFRNHPAAAAGLFERALALQPEHVPSLIWLGAMQLVAGNTDAADAALSRALTLQPRDPAALYHAGRVALSKRDYRLAVDRLNAALTAAPGASSIHYPLSLAYRGLGDVRNADAQLTLRGNVDPAPSDPLMQQVSGVLQNASAFEVRGADALSKRQWPAAITALRQALELSPNNAFTHLNLGTALFENGDPSGALSEFREAVRLSPDLTKAHYGIGIVAESIGHDADALDAFASAVKADPDFAEARLSYGDALRRNGRDSDALPQYEAVIKISPSASPAYFGAAMALVHAKRWMDARDALNRAVAVFPDQAGFAHALARVLAAAPDNTVRDGRRALTLVEALSRTQRTLELMQTAAMALAEVGRFDEAVQWQREAIAAAAQSNRRDLAVRLEENLRHYEQRLPCRIPWPEDDPVFRPRPSR